MENISINMADMKQLSLGSKHDKNSKSGKESKANVKQREEEVNKTKKHTENERERDKWLLEWKKEIREELQLKHNRSN